MKIACYTLGCKVNQYDTQAMMESFERAGYERAEFSERADVYLINTCTVTKSGDDKSLKAIRRVAREHPDAAIIVAGCLAQRDVSRVKLPGVRLILGTAHRAQAAELFERAMSEGICVSATGDLGGAFEPLAVSRHEGRTRATIKIQEGCDRFCSYCIVPYVRGPVRSMPLLEVVMEARRLSEAGYREIVLTGIHLMSYGRGEGLHVEDAALAVSRVSGIDRIRLGSLSPEEVTEKFARALSESGKVCPQFHLSLQSGSDSVLRRMNRRYTKAEYLKAAGTLREYFPGLALTTDVIVGFPGETREEFKETLTFCEEAAFARIHVFPYSRREGTGAFDLPGQVDKAEKDKRVSELIALGNKLEKVFVNRLVGTRQFVLFESHAPDGLCEGYTGSFVRVRARAEAGALDKVLITRTEDDIAYGEKEGM